MQPGEGPKQIAERAEITVDQLFALNGMDPNNYMLYPGQELRVK
ncbi:LysM domain-containing protein [Enterococcus lactis]